MKRFQRLKTIQLILYLILTGAGLVVIFTDEELYHAIAADPHVRFLCFLLWAALGLAFVFLYFDFGSYMDIRRENNELDRAVYSDILTGVANRYSCDAYIGQYIGRPLPEDMGCITLDLINLGEINRLAGHDGGDEAIRWFSEILLGAAGGSKDYFIGRNGGNKFLVILRNADEKKAEEFLRKTAEGCARSPFRKGIEVAYHAGTALAAKEKADSLTELVALSDRRAG